MNPKGLLGIDYAFHVTLILAGAALASCFMSVASEWSRARR